MVAHSARRGRLGRYAGSVRAVTVISGASTLVFGSLLVASPASAATLPDGQRITIVNAFEDSESNGQVQAYRSDPAGAVSEPGPTTAELDVNGVDVDEDGRGFAVVQGFTELEAPIGMLYAFDATTGTFSDPRAVLLAGTETATSNCQELDYSGGLIVATCQSFDGQQSTTYLGVITLEGDHAVLTPSLVIGPAANPTSFNAVAVDPLNGRLWVFGSDGDSGSFGWWAVDRSAAQWTLGTQVPDVTDLYLGADYDRAGQLWATLGDPENGGHDHLATVDPAAGTSTDLGPFTLDGAPLGVVEPITVWGKPALPATGPADVLPLGVGTALLFLAGGALIVTHRPQRRGETS